MKLDDLSYLLSRHFERNPCVPTKLAALGLVLHCENRSGLSRSVEIFVIKNGIGLIVVT